MGELKIDNFLQQPFGKIPIVNQKIHQPEHIKPLSSHKGSEEYRNSLPPLLQNSDNTLKKFVKILWHLKF